MANLTVPVRITILKDDLNACELGLSRFHEAMNRRLTSARYMGRIGWNRPSSTGWGCTVRHLEVLLSEAVDDGDLVNIANYCMMIWNRKHPKGVS